MGVMRWVELCGWRSGGAYFQSPGGVVQFAVEVLNRFVFKPVVDNSKAMQTLTLLFLGATSQTVRQAFALLPRNRCFLRRICHLPPPYLVSLDASHSGLPLCGSPKLISQFVSERCSCCSKTLAGFSASFQCQRLRRIPLRCLVPDRGFDITECL